MDGHRIKHDVSFDLSKNIVGIFKRFLTQEEIAELLHLTYIAVKNGLQTYDEQLQRMHQQLEPMKH